MIPHAKPRGLWKATTQSRRANNDRLRNNSQQPTGFQGCSPWPKQQPKSGKATGALALIFGDSDTDEADDELESLSNSSNSSFKRTHDDDDDDELDDWDYPATKRLRIMPLHINTTSIAVPVENVSKEGCDIEDWEELKDLFNTATEQYESEEPKEAIAYIRAVINECNRFLIFYQDPSVVFTRPPSNPPSPPTGTTRKRKQKPVELPTAFHAILGTALFLFGNLIAQDHSLVLEGEPDYPTPYWLSALDVFETGENLPSRTSGLPTGSNPSSSSSSYTPSPFEGQEDWRMAIVWGRTLVCIADEMLSRAKRSGEPLSNESFDEDLLWPIDSPLHTIAARHPPTTRTSFFGSSANDLMVLAMDQFSRGIFHMPHTFSSSNTLLSSSSSATITASSATSGPSINTTLPVSPLRGTFSRPRELYTISSEVLLLSEKMSLFSERQKWALYADSIFAQMRMENPVHSNSTGEDFTRLIDAARGRCWLIIGSAKAEELEEELLENQDVDLQGEDAQEAREALERAVEFLERAVSAASKDEEQLRPLLVESLLTLANLTPEENQREELYAKAQREGAGEMGIVLDNNEMDVDS